MPKSNAASIMSAADWREPVTFVPVAFNTGTGRKAAVRAKLDISKVFLEQDAQSLARLFRNESATAKQLAESSINFGQQQRNAVRDIFKADIPEAEKTRRIEQIMATGALALPFLTK